MKAHGVVLDTQAHAVHINSRAHGSMVLPLTKYKAHNPAINKLEGKNLEKILVVCDYSDVFPEDLPGLPPDRDVEFVIELQPGTAPISRRPYRMPSNELAELK